MAENKCDELFGKNGELVEFRKKQVLEGAFGIIQRHYKEMPNKMEVIAAIFDKQLGERFSVKVNNQIYDCSFEEYGFDGRGAYENPYLDFDTFILQELLTGTAVIIDE